MNKLLHDLDSSGDDSSSDDNTGPSATPADLAKPWLKEFNQYLNMIDELSDGQTLVQLWGHKYFLSLVQICVIINFDFHQLNAHQYPVWASLAHDHLTIMASSVSSE